MVSFEEAEDIFNKASRKKYLEMTGRKSKDVDIADEAYTLMYPLPFRKRAYPEKLIKALGTTAGYISGLDYRNWQNFFKEKTNA